MASREKERSTRLTTAEEGSALQTATIKNRQVAKKIESLRALPPPGFGGDRRRGEGRASSDTRSRPIFGKPTELPEQQLYVSGQHAFPLGSDRADVVDEFSHDLRIPDFLRIVAAEHDPVGG